MLPLPLYELLPYIYLGVGAIACAWFDSELILIASVLIILAGFIIIWMRIEYRRNSPGRVYADKGFVERSGTDRRQISAAIFPLVDSHGVLIKNDRRATERRSVSA